MLNANYDNTFNDYAKIWLAGSGEAVDPVDPSLVVTFEDTFNNRIYQTTQPSDPAQTGLGYEMLARAQLFMDAYDEAVADGSTTPDWLDYYKWRVTNMVENIEVVRGLYDLYGYMYF